MTEEDRQLLLEASEVIRGLLDLQISTNRSFRTLFLALKRQMPTMEADYLEAQKDSLFATKASVQAEKLHAEIETLIEHLKKP
jgi:hypothetical protein